MLPSIRAIPLDHDQKNGLYVTSFHTNRKKNLCKEKDMKSFLKNMGCKSNSLKENEVNALLAT